MSNLYTILGATGKVGGETIRFFSAAGIYCRAITRHPEKMKKLPYVSWIRGDLEDQASLESLLAGSTGIFLVTGVTDNMAQVQRNIIDSAKAVGVRHIVKLSAPGAAPDSHSPVGRMHWEPEQHLKASGLAWHILQLQSFMQNWLGLLAESVRAERKIYEAAGDGKKPFIDTRDIGEVVFTLLTQQEKFPSQTFALSGGEAIGYRDVAEAIGKATNEKVDYVSLSPDEARARFAEKGVPAWAIETFLAISAHQRSGAAAKAVSGAVAAILGKPPRTVHDFAKDHAAHFISTKPANA
jgi:uncharacterized protein YbjT (DUF2867 family)